MKGILYGVGVGPGDPELMTLKACRLIRENEVIAFPGQSPERSAAYRIAAEAVPEIADKTLLALDMPMTRDRKILGASHDKAADRICAFLRRGENVLFLTLGDVSIYSTFAYLQERVEGAGFAARLVSGIPSFTAAAARLGTSLVSGRDQLHIYPAGLPEGQLPEGTLVVMKAGSHLGQIRRQLRESGEEAQLVENCGMAGEKIYTSVEEMPDKAGYFSLLIVKDEAEGK